MSEDLSYEVLESEELQGKDKLPNFLSVLTILTFIGSGLNILSGIYNLATLETQKAQMAQAMENIDEIPEGFARNMVEGAAATIEHMPTLQTTAILVAIGCIIGAILMRRLKKNGFYIYLLACIASIAVPLFVVGSGVMGAFVLLGSVFTIAFVIMYGVNLKYMN